MNRSQAKKSSGMSKGMGMKPPQFESTFAVGKTVRFTASSSAGIGVTRASLLDLFVMAETTTAAGRIFDAVKIKRIRIWGNAPGAGAVATRTTSLQWLSTYSPARVISDSGSGATYGARISTIPPAMSLAGFWSLTGTNESDTLLLLTLNQGDVVDLDLSFRIQNNLFQADPPAAVTVVAATVGTVYCLALDFASAGAAAVVTPVGYITIT